eukprot:4151333-Amphidinium_carterae.2
MESTKDPFHGAPTDMLSGVFACHTIKERCCCYNVTLSLPLSDYATPHNPKHRGWQHGLDPRG